MISNFRMIDLQKLSATDNEFLRLKPDRGNGSGEWPSFNVYHELCPLFFFLLPSVCTHLVPVSPFISLPCVSVLFSSRPEGRLTYRFRESGRVVQSGLRRRVCVVQKCWRRLQRLLASTYSRPAAVTVDVVADNRCVSNIGTNQSVLHVTQPANRAFTIVLQYCPVSLV